jgi:hypothetical protein
MGNSTENKNKETVLENIRSFLNGVEGLGDLRKADITELRHGWTKNYDDLREDVKLIPELENHELVHEMKTTKRSMEKTINEFFLAMAELTESFEHKLNRLFGNLDARDEAATNVRNSWGLLTTLQRVEDEINFLDEKLEAEKENLQITDEALYDLAKDKNEMKVKLSSLESYTGASTPTRVYENIRNDLVSMFGRDVEELKMNKIFRFYIAKGKNDKVAEAFGIKVPDNGIMAITVGVNDSAVTDGNEGDQVTLPLTIQGLYPARFYTLKPQVEVLETSYSEPMHFMKNHPPAQITAKIYINVSSILPNY